MDELWQILSTFLHVQVDKQQTDTSSAMAKGRQFIHVCQMFIYKNYNYQNNNSHTSIG